MEAEGIPIDVELHTALAEHWEELKAGLVREVDAAYCVFDDTVFKRDRFAALLARLHIP